jgi:transcriptional accessory protein Tex/SPT6
MCEFCRSKTSPSKHLLSYVSGIGREANIVNYRSENGPLRIESNSKKVPRLGEKPFSKVLLLFELKTGKPIG